MLATVKIKAILASQILPGILPQIEQVLERALIQPSPLSTSDSEDFRDFAKKFLVANRKFHKYRDSVIKNWLGKTYLHARLRNGGISLVSVKSILAFQCFQLKVLFPRYMWAFSWRVIKKLLRIAQVRLDRISCFAASAYRASFLRLFPSPPKLFIRPRGDMAEQISTYLVGLNIQYKVLPRTRVIFDLSDYTHYKRFADSLSDRLDKKVLGSIPKGASIIEELASAPLQIQRGCAYEWRMLEGVSLPDTLDNEKLRSVFRTFVRLDKYQSGSKNESPESGIVGIHFRVADIVTDSVVLKTKKMPLSLPFSYYEKAIQIIRQRIPDPKWRIFLADDISEEILNQIIVRFGNNLYFVRESSLADLRRFTECSHFVTSNSYFSYLAAWYASNSASLVVAPIKWMPFESPGFTPRYPGNWKTI